MDGNKALSAHKIFLLRYKIIKCRVCYHLSPKSTILEPNSLSTTFHLIDSVQIRKKNKYHRKNIPTKKKAALYKQIVKNSVHIVLVVL